MGQTTGKESEVFFKWDEVIPRMKKAMNAKNDKELREFLELGSSNFSNYKNAKRVPQKWIFKFATKKGIQFEKIVRPDVIDVPENRYQQAPPEIQRISEAPPPSKPEGSSGLFPPQYERRKWLRLRRLINDICGVDGIYGAIAELIEMGLPNVTPIVLREIHRRNPRMLS